MGCLSDLREGGTGNGCYHMHARTEDAPLNLAVISAVQTVTHDAYRSRFLQG